MNQKTFIPFGIGTLALIQAIIYIFGLNSVFNNPEVALALSMWALGGILLLLAGFNFEIFGADFRILGGVGYILNAIGFTAIMIVSKPWQSPTNLYPEPLMVVFVGLFGLLFVAIGLDMATNQGYIMKIEPRQ